MKKLLLIALLAFNAQAGDLTTVQASGSGDTCKQALANAKRNALDKANGSFLHSVVKSNDGSYSANIEEYSGGVIKSYKYLRDDCTFVIIEAEVLRRSNVVQMESANVNQQQIIHVQGIKEAEDVKAKAIQLINNRKSAVYFAPVSTQFNSIEGTSDVTVTIDGKFAYTDKWKADYLDLREMYGYFNLTDFVPDAKIVVTGLDASRTKVFETTFYGDDWKLWIVRTYGATRTMEIIPHAKESAMVKFRIPMNKLEQVKSFKVEVI